MEIHKESLHTYLKNGKDTTTAYKDKHFKKMEIWKIKLKKN